MQSLTSSWVCVCVLCVCMCAFDKLGCETSLASQAAVHQHCTLSKVDNSAVVKIENVPLRQISFWHAIVATRHLPDSAEHAGVFWRC